MPKPTQRRNAQVVFGDGNKSITEMQSMAGERVPLLKAVPVDENVETWLGLLAQAMVGTLSTMLGQCIALKDYQKYPSQLLSIADMHHFTQKAEVAMSQVRRTPEWPFGTPRTVRV